MTHVTVTCRLTAKNRDQLWNPTLGNRVWLPTFFLGLFVAAAYRPFVVVMMLLISRVLNADSGQWADT